MAAKPQVKIAPERRGETRVWNVSDHPATKVAPQSVMVLGRTLHPGRSMRVATNRLEKAHKVTRDVQAGLLFVGDTLPSDYQAVRPGVRAKLPKGVGRAHGVTAPRKPTVAKTQVKEKVVVRESMKVTPVLKSADLDAGKKK